MHKFLSTVICCAIFSLSANVQASEQNLPAEKTEHGVTYVSGGIGSDESNAMKRAAANYPLECIFTVKSAGKEIYLADVHVRLSDKQGKVLLDTVSDGPYLFAKLADGYYRIEAIREGSTKTQSIEIKNGAHKKVVFSWFE
ncbi:hypothetical protein [Undibacterium sp. WLX3042]|uniref:hypothetical protein n=1 Tax=Undibacterium sp. WLX3042 TaxID=3412686 RepID=UPI003C2BAD38